MNVTGALDKVDEHGVEGWCLGNADGSPETVRICLGRDIVAIHVADRFRGDLQRIARDGFCAFAHAWPYPLRKTAPLLIVRRQDGSVLGTGPEPDPTPEIMTGAIDIADRLRIAGWVVDPLAPDRTVRVTVIVDGVPCAELVANGFRPDLRTAGHGLGMHGFDHVFDHPLDPGSHRIMLICDCGLPVPGCPIEWAASTDFDVTTQTALTRIVDALDNSDARTRAATFFASQIGRLAARDHAEAAQTAQRSRQRRLKRQQAQLASQGPPPRVLIIDDHPPDPTRDAGSVALLSHITALIELGFEVSLVPAQALTPDQLNDTPATYGFTLLQPPFCETPEQVLRAQGHSFEVVYLHRLSNARRYIGLVRHHAPAATLIWSIADLASVRVRRQGHVEQKPEMERAVSALEVHESMAAWSVDVVIVHTEWERDLMARRVPSTRVVEIPWHVPLRPAKPLSERRDVVFLGHFAHAPNMDAARWLAHEIMPRLRARHPDLRCLLIGSAMGDALYRLGGDGIEIVGHVPDLADVMGNARLMLAALRFGSGLKGKVLEAWAHGVPVMMTPIAAEGIGLPPTLQLDVRGEADGYAAGALQLLDDDAHASAHIASARLHLQTHFSARRIRRAMAEAVGQPDLADELPNAATTPS